MAVIQMKPTNPFEVGWANILTLMWRDDVVGIAALRQIAETGPKRHQLGLILEGEKPAPLGFAWEDLLDQNGTKKRGDDKFASFHRGCRPILAMRWSAQSCSLGISW